MKMRRSELWVTEASGEYRLCAKLALFVKLLLLWVGISIWAVYASAQEVRQGGATLPDALPPTSLVASTPSGPAPESSTNSRLLTGHSPTSANPSIIWHQVNGRWHWHCVAHCSKFRAHGEEP
jgi:hypothetical protein